jgi:hypothetical protein
MKSYDTWPFYLLSLNAVFLRFIYLSHESVLHSFLRWVIFHCIVRIYHNLFIYSLVDGHLDYFHLLPIVNSATINMCINIWVPFSVLLGIYIGVELLGHVILYSSSLRSCHLHSHHQHKRIPGFHIHANTCYFPFLSSGYPSM